jgi:ABC-type multidrug transport system ATPase subunit
MLCSGPSGAGKTTLLHCMAGRAQYPLIGGQVLFDGRVRDSRTKRRIGYCTQDDIFFTKLTVRETLDFTAAIRMEGRLSKAQRQQRVDEIVLKLRLSKCLDTRIGDQQFDKGISGGERKRVNIANELLGRAEGGILLLDEPTSGLDSSSALMVVRLLRQLADEGHAIVSTLHQPTSQMLQLFDTVLMLSEGEVVYFGPTAKATGYFSSPAVGFPTPPNYNPADFFMQLLIDDDIFAPDGGVAGGGGDRSTGSTGSDVHAPAEEDGAGAGAAVPRGATQPRSGSVGSSASQEVARHYLMRCWRQHGAAFLAAEYPEALAGMGVSPHGGDAPRVAGAGDEATRRRRQGVAAAQRVFQGPARAVAKRARGATGRPDPTGMPDKYATGWTTQVRVLGLRALRQKRGALVDGIQLAQLASIIVICALFWFRMGSTEAALDDRLGALFFFNVFFAFFSTFSALFAFPAEKAVLNKDRASGTYRLSAYYLAKTCVEIPADMLYPSLFAIVVYFAIDLNAKADRFFIFVAILIGITLTAQSMGLAISAAMMNVRQAQVLSSVLILTSMLIGGLCVTARAHGRRTALVLCSEVW